MARAFQWLAYSILLSVLFLPAGVHARVYIDITSPAFTPLPMAIYELLGPTEGREVARIIKEDLEFSGLFSAVDREAYIESPLPVFDPQNWSPLGVDLVLKGSLNLTADRIEARVYLYDVIEARKILQKHYIAKHKHVRSLAHTIADDLYKKITGEDGVFRTKIAFVGDRQNRKIIYIVDWDGERIRNTGIEGELLLTPHWSRDGTRLVYSSTRGGQWGLFLVDFKRKREKLLIRSEGTHIAGDFLPDGSAFVFSSSLKGTPDIYLFYVDTLSRKRITNWRGIEISPAVSPDGKSIAFVSDHGGSPQVYVMQTDGGNVRRVTFSGNYNTSPVWSPRGDRISYSGRVGGLNQIFTIKIDGTELMQLTSSGNNEEPSFSPDGRFIAFSSDRKGTKGVYIMRANGEQQKRISPKKMRAFGPGWSPNKIF
jgi:TolB protein